MFCTVFIALCLTSRDMLNLHLERSALPSSLLRAALQGCEAKLSMLLLLTLFLPVLTQTWSRSLSDAPCFSWCCCFVSPRLPCRVLRCRSRCHLKKTCQPSQTQQAAAAVQQDPLQAVQAAAGHQQQCTAAQQQQQQVGCGLAVSGSRYTYPCIRIVGTSGLSICGIHCTTEKNETGTPNILVNPSHPCTSQVLLTGYSLNMQAGPVQAVLSGQIWRRRRQVWLCLRARRCHGP